MYYGCIHQGKEAVFLPVGHHGTNQETYWALGLRNVDYWLIWWASKVEAYNTQQCVLNYLKHSWHQCVCTGALRPSFLEILWMIAGIWCCFSSVEMVYSLLWSNPVWVLTQSQYELQYQHLRKIRFIPFCSHIDASWGWRWHIHNYLF